MAVRPEEEEPAACCAGAAVFRYCAEHQPCRPPGACTRVHWGLESSSTVREVPLGSTESTALPSDGPCRRFRFAVVSAVPAPAAGETGAWPEKLRYCLKQYPSFPLAVRTFAHWGLELSSTVTATFLPSVRITFVPVPAPARRFR